jgi:phosphohistidine phosphatase
MKTLIVVRHAKSSWSESGLSDFDRPLNERGKRDAPVMADRLQKEQKTIDLFISSPAKRAKKTAELFAEKFKYDTDKIVYFPELYLAGPRDFVSTITQTPSEVKSVIIFSHNPGVTEFVNMLTDTRIDDMPTCAVFIATINIDKWTDFEKADKEFQLFDYPKSTQN